MSRSSLSSLLARSTNPVYLDCAATSPIEPVVLEEIIRILTEEPGNAGSRTHQYGIRAKRIIQNAREQVAEVVRAKTDEVLFTSGATESNNIAILGLAAFGIANKRRHIVSTAIEHKAVLEPLQALEKQGFEVTLVPPEITGAVSTEAIREVLRPDTLLVSVMHVNNETGIYQPIKEIAGMLTDHDSYFHVDAAQGFGKDIHSLQSDRIDMISISAHKIFGPMGVGSLVIRRRGHKKLPLAPTHFGGGQERGLRPGTLPVSLISGLGLAAELSLRDYAQRRNTCFNIRSAALEVLAPLDVTFIGDPKLAIPHILNFAVEGIDSEALMVALKDMVSISNGSACTSQSYEVSHVLTAMNVPESLLNSSVRLSWCHLTPNIDWMRVAERINVLN